MQIFVTLPDNTDIALDVEGSDTILGVKSKIRIQTGIPISQQILTYNDITLVDTSTLTDYNIQKNSIIVLTIGMAYTNIYVQPFLKISQRKKWTEFINTTAIFDPTQIYLPNDPDFGVQTNIKMFLEFGIQQLNLADYVPALQTNFYRKRLTFGNVKVATAKDTSGNYIYDAVYVEMIDELQGIKSAVSMNNNTYYPSSIDNMRSALSNITLPDESTIIVDIDQLPRFMSAMAHPSPTDYTTVLVLCYALPEQGKAIASRIRASKFDFKQLDFDVDRLIIENSLDNTTAKYLMFPHAVITDAGE